LFALPFVGKIDVVWAANPDLFALVPAIAYGGIKRKPIVSNVDDLIIEDLYDLSLVERDSAVSKLAEFFARVLFAKVKGATPISPGYIETITKYGVDKRNIQVVRGGVDLNVFKYQPKGNVEGKFVVLYSGGFSIAYDFEQIFQAGKIIEGLDDNVEFVIQGKGELLDAMCSRVKELKLKNVLIIDNLLSREAVGAFLSQADVLILPLADFKTPYRGMSSKLYEYLAVGRPIICCCRGLPAFFVEDTDSGLVVNPGDAEALALAVLGLKRAPGRCKTYGENGRKWVEAEGSIKAIGVQINKVLSNL
jgi:glycosyltransferase involved in cell wall biosynthesis